MKFSYIVLVIMFGTSYASAVNYSVSTAFNSNLRQCSMFQSSLEELKLIEESERKFAKEPEKLAMIQDLKKDLLIEIGKQSRVEAATATVSFKTPVVFGLQNLKVNIAGTSVVRAVVNVPVLGAKVTENSVEIPNSGSASIQVVFTLAGLCPFVEASGAGVDLKTTIEKALRTIIK